MGASKSKIYSGFKVSLKGLLRGSSKKKKIVYKFGINKFKTFNRYVDYAFYNYKSLKDGIYGIKVWLSYSNDKSILDFYNSSVISRKK